MKGRLLEVGGAWRKVDESGELKFISVDLFIFIWHVRLMLFPIHERKTDSFPHYRVCMSVGNDSPGNAKGPSNAQDPNKPAF